MLDRTIYFSRDTRYKDPFGAVPLGRAVRFTLRPHHWEGFTACTLLTYGEFADCHQETPLSPAGSEGDRALFSGVFSAPEAVELVWYAFRFRRPDGSCICLGKNGYCNEQDLQRWQLTVYDGSTATPDWFGRGVTYQIFPDRFCRSRIPDPTGMVGDRLVHQNWEEGMEYLPDEHGEIRNRDFFGGDLQGVISKLDYLEDLGVTTLYFCPIFEADSNHRYNTADYSKIDPMLGTEEDFRTLCREAHRRGMKVMLDGVFNHTGNNSLYFNALGFYPTLGAAQSQESPYYSWYHFHHWPDQYDSWWGIHTLPAVNEGDPTYVDYIIEGRDSIVRRWLRLGADAWRLDVADELPDWFIEKIRAAMDAEKPGSFLLGEVWEDGSNKIAYSQRRRYLLGHETHGLMNYPFRVAALAYLQGGPARDFVEAMETIRENYPPAAFHSALNMLGTHDNPRILTMLGAAPPVPLETRQQRANYHMGMEERGRGSRRLMTGALLLYGFPGSPMIYYGDEAGMEGFEDPFNRGTFPWDREDPALLSHFRRLGQLRQSRISLQKGDLRYLYQEGCGLAFQRKAGDEVTLVALNTGSKPVEMTFDWPEPVATDAVTGQQFNAWFGRLHIIVPPLDGMMLV